MKRANASIFDLYMPIANTTFNCKPKDFPLLKEICQPNCGQKYGPPGTRNITVIIPNSSLDGDDAAVLIDLEGTDWIWNSDVFTHDLYS